MRKEDMEQLRGMVVDRLGMENEEIEIKEVQKNNGTKKTAVIIRDTKSETNVSPCIYVDDILEQWWSGDEGSIERTAGMVADRVRKALENAVYMPPITLTKEEILDNAYYVVVGTEKNRDLLKDLPHRVMADLAIIVKTAVNAIQDGIQGSITVNNGIVSAYGIDEDELFRKAAENMQDGRGFVCMSIGKMMASLMGIADDEYTDSPEGLYVLTNDSKLNGAAVLAFPETLERLISGICPNGSTPYILPSSIHEVMVFVGEGLDANMLKAMVTEINATQVEPEDVLSNSVYVFDTNDKTLRIAA